MWHLWWNLLWNYSNNLSIVLSIPLECKTMLQNFNFPLGFCIFVSFWMEDKTYWVARLLNAMQLQLLYSFQFHNNYQLGNLVSRPLPKRIPRLKNPSEKTLSLCCYVWDYCIGLKDKIEGINWYSVQICRTTDNMIY